MLLAEKKQIKMMTPTQLRRQRKKPLLANLKTYSSPVKTVQRKNSPKKNPVKKISTLKSRVRPLLQQMFPRRRNLKEKEEVKEEEEKEEEVKEDVKEKEGVTALTWW